MAGTSAILDEGERRQLVDLRWLAYMPATTFHEADSTMQPIFEKGQRSYFDKYETGTKKGAELGNTKPGDGYLYRGRGFVQLTGRANYEKTALKSAGDDLDDVAKLAPEIIDLLRVIREMICPEPVPPRKRLRRRGLSSSISSG